MLLGKIDNKNIIKEIVVSDPDVNLSSLSKIALLSVLVGYHKGKDIQLEGQLKTSEESLGEFMNFLLNHKGFAPIDYDVELHYNRKEADDSSPRNSEKKVAVLFSGGIDSTAAVLYYLNQGIKPLLISLDFGQINNKREQEIIKDISKKLDLELISFKINISEEVLSGWDEWQYIVPCRNFLIASLGADIFKSRGYSGKIILAATGEEINHPNPGPDKSKRFYNFCSKYFSKECNTKIDLESPFVNLTKSGILRIWKDKWIKNFKISPYETSTCYYGTECGRCNSCFKRSLALLSAGFDLDPGIKANPFKQDPEKVVKYIGRIEDKNGGFTQERKEDTLNALIRAKDLGLLNNETATLVEKLERSA